MSATLTRTNSSASTRQRPVLIIPKAPPAGGGGVSRRAEQPVEKKAQMPDMKRKGKGKDHGNTLDPWLVSLPALERFAANAGEHRVIFILGDPPMNALRPILTSSSLAGSLVLLASLSLAPAQVSIMHPMPSAHPTIRTVKLDPKRTQESEAAQIMQLLERGEKIARVWKKSEDALSTSRNTLKERDTLRALSSLVTPPSPESSRPGSPTSFNFSLSSFRRPSISSLRPSMAPRPLISSPRPVSPSIANKRTFDAVIVFLPSTPLSDASASHSSDFELRAHAAHAQLKLAILIGTLATPFLTPRPRQARDGRPSTSTERRDLLRSPSESLTAQWSEDKKSSRLLGFLQAHSRRPSASSLTIPESSSASFLTPPSLSTSSSFTSLSTTGPTPPTPTSPAHLVHVLPPGLDQSTQSALARSLDGFLCSLRPFNEGPNLSDLSSHLLQTYLLPLRALSDTIGLSLPSSPPSSPQTLCALELILANSLTQPFSTRPTRWLPCLAMPYLRVDTSPTSTAPNTPSTAPSSLSMSSTEPSPQFSPSHPLSKLDIPIHSHVLHSRAESMGKHRSGHRDRIGVVVGATLPVPLLPTPPASESSVEGDTRERTPLASPVSSASAATPVSSASGGVTPSSGGSVATVKKRRWGFHL